ncbi:MAG: GGDEF domain-containing protein [Lachnospiraceae bacterium]|nr:GGDEF domain-containing protein [Candidatus Merdinaster equi]
MNIRSLLEKKEALYSRMYMGTAIFHLICIALYLVDLCWPPAILDFVMCITYIVLANQVHKARKLSNVFIACGIAIMVNTIGHLFMMGPTLGYQNLFLATIPVLFFIAYTGDWTLKKSIIYAVLLFVLSIVIMGVSEQLVFGFFYLGDVVRTILRILNQFSCFVFASGFMVFLVVQASSDTGMLKNKRDELEISANRDELTGLRNRRSIDQFMEDAFKRARGEGQDFTVFMCDVDNFKRVNDTYGHDCGDLVLKNIANTIQAELRVEDVAFRYGGEEILVLVVAGGHIAKRIAERCRIAIEASEVVYKDKSVKVTITIGGSSYYQGATKDDLIKRADNNLYIGKNNGKNQVVM